MPAPRRNANNNHHRIGKISEGITPQTSDEDQRLQEFLSRELAAFDTVQGPTDHIEHRIHLITNQSIKQRFRLGNPAMQAIIIKKVRKMEEAKIIEPSQNAWNCPIVIIKKKTAPIGFASTFAN